jgi:hypothetical protein
MLAYLTGASNPRNAYPAFRTPFEVEKCGNGHYLVAAGRSGHRYRISTWMWTVLLRLDAGCPDHFAPLLDFVSDEFGELGG